MHAPAGRRKPHSRLQSLRSFWPTAGIESSGSNHFEITKEKTEFCPSGFTQSLSMAHAWNDCSQSSRFLPQARRIVGSGDENAETLALSSHIYFLLFETPNVARRLCSPLKRDVEMRVSGSKWVKVRSLIKWTGHSAIYMRWLLGWRYISPLHSADEFQEGRNSCSLLRSCFIGSCHVGVSKRLLRGISIAVYCLPATHQ